MHKLATIAVVLSLSLPALADEQQDVTAALRKASDAKQKQLPREIEQAMAQLKSAKDAKEKARLTQELSALQELQKKFEAGEKFYVPDVEFPPNDSDWIGKVKVDGGDLSVGAELPRGEYLLLWQKAKSTKQSAIVYKPRHGRKLSPGGNAELSGVFRVIGKNGTGQWRVQEVPQDMVDKAKEELTASAKPDRPCRE
jgi:hypothetical protein